MTIELGQNYTDMVSGFTGEAIAKAEYKYGSNRVEIQPLMRDNFIEPQWIDESRLKASASINPNEG